MKGSKTLVKFQEQPRLFNLLSLCHQCGEQEIKLQGRAQDLHEVSSRIIEAKAWPWGQQDCWLVATGSVAVWCASEKALTSVVGVVMVYDSATRKWNDTGESNIQIYQNIADNTFRIVASSRQTGQVSLSRAQLKKIQQQGWTTFCVDGHMIFMGVDLL